MPKETVRYPDNVTEAVEAVDEAYFSSKSEFYRFSAMYVLDELGVEFEDQDFRSKKRTVEQVLDGGFEEELYDAISTYASGLADRNPRVAGVGLDMLYDIDDKLGEIAERELEKIE